MIGSGTVPFIGKIIWPGTVPFQMWAGRLEFISVFALLGTIFALVRGR